MDCHVVLAGVLHECQVWTSVYSFWLFLFFQITTYTLLFLPHQQQTPTERHLQIVRYSSESRK